MSVYIIAAPALGLCKIGYARDVHARFSQIAAVSPSPVELVAVRNGGRDLEQAIHGRLVRDRHHREWFWYSSRTIEAFHHAQSDEFYASRNSLTHPLFLHRMRNGMTISRLARDLGVDHGRISGVERWQVPREPLLSRLCGLLNCSPLALRRPVHGGPLAVPSRVVAEGQAFLRDLEGPAQ